MNRIRRLRLLDCLEIFLMAIILNLNAIRIIMRSSDFLTYFVFLSFSIIVAVNEFGIRRKKYIYYNDVVIPLLLSFIYIVFSSLGNENALSKLIKFVSCIIVANMASYLDNDKRALGLQLSAIISTVYSIYLIININAIYSLGSSRVFNYLDITLPIGLGLSFLLSSLFIGKMWQTSFLNLAVIIFSIVVHLYSIIQLYARGNLVFPIIIAIALLLYNNKTSLKKIMMSGVVVIGLLLISYNIFLRFANERLIRRLMNLFTNISQEDRFPIYRFYIDYIIQDFRFVFGMGFRSSTEVLQKAGFSVSYPHNFILELVGELGIVGLSLILCILGRIWRSAKKELKNFRSISVSSFVNEKILYYATLAGFLFYMFSYFKSYSIYDGYQFFIFIGWIIHKDKRAFTPDNNGYRRSNIVEYQNEHNLI